MKNDDSISGYLFERPAEMTNGRFTDIEVIAESASSLLLRAKRHGRWWLLKGLPPSRATQTLYQTALQKEFDILNHLQHPGIAAVVDKVEPGDEYPGHFILMEWIEGQTLTDWLKTTHSTKEKLHVLSQLLDAVGYVHSKGFVHRDIKPSNIMIARQGRRVVLIDFGLADSDTYDILKHPAGTPGYISPEQQTTSTADIRNDIYSIGILMQAMGLPHSYDRIIKRCSRKACRRYPDVDALRKAMSDVNRSCHLFRILIVAITIMAAAIAILILLPYRDMDHSSETVSNQPEVRTDTILSLTTDTDDSQHPPQRQEAAATQMMPKDPSAMAANRADTDEMRHSHLVDSVTASIRAVYDAEVCKLEAEFDTVSAPQYQKRYSNPSKVWRKCYHTLDWKGIGLNEDDLDKIYSRMERYDMECHQKWIKRYKRLSSLSEK